MGIAERRKREKEQRRNAILDAAEQVFFEKGYQNAKMDDVAETAELSKGTLYLYFKTKEELYFGLTHRALLNLRDRFRQVLNQKTTGMKKITDIGRAYYQFSIEEPEYFKTIAQYELAQLETEDDGETISQKCHQEGQAVMELVAAAISEGMEDGTVRNNIDPMKTAFLLQGTSTGIIQLMAREGKHLKELEHFEAEELLDGFIEMTIRALQPESAN